jgi:segregation and condensation protein A
LRLAPPPKVERVLDLSGVTPLDLLEAVRRALALMPDKPELGTVVAAPRVTIRDQIRMIADALKEHGGRVVFQRLLENAHSRMEIVVTFLATLELTKRRKVEARQSEMFGEIELISLGEWTDDDSVFAELEFE